MTDPDLVRKLFEALNWSQWPATRQLASSPCRLCHHCRAIDFASQSYELQRSLQDLYKTSAECVLCTFLYRHLSALDAKVQEPLKLVRTESTIKLHPLDQPIISLYCDTGVPARKSPETYTQADLDRPESGSALPALSFATLGLPLLPEPASPEQFLLLNSLIHHCDESHDCMAAQKHLQSPASSGLPTRLIDVGKGNTDPIRLVRTSEKLAAMGQYITLSHCWGPARNLAVLTRARIAQMMESISYHDLPASYQDAVRITRALGSRYLWIDSLCIIQDDSDDWTTEVNRMEDVFSNAYCRIAASSAASVSVGFLGPRRLRDAIRLSTPEGALLYLAEHIDDFRADVERSVLSSRAWILQERALSRRTIYFTSTQVYWECGHGVVCETLSQLRKLVMLALQPTG